MGFNLGAFAGGLAQGGLNTYKSLSEIESQKKKDALVDLQMQEAKAAMEERAALKDAAGVYGQVGGGNYAPELQRTAGIGQQQAQGLAVNTGAGGSDFDQAVNESTQGVLRENAQRQGAALPTDTAMKPAAYTRDQADADYLARVRAINPERALETENKQIQTATGRSALARMKAEDEFSQWHQKAQEQITTDPVQFIKAHLPEYNKAKKGSHLDDGYTAEVIAGATPNAPASLVRKDAKGKLVDSTPIDRGLAEQALEHIAFAKYSALPGKFKESAELRNQGLTAGAAAENAKTNASELSAKMTAGLFGAQAKQALGAANASNAHAAVYNNMLTLAKENKAAGEAMKPFIKEFGDMTPEDQQGSKGIAVLTAGAAAAAKKTGDITGIISALKKPEAKSWTMSPDGSFRSNAAGVVQDFDSKTNMWKTRGLPEVNANAAKAGVIADVNPSGQVGYKGKDGWYSTEQEAFQSFNASSKSDSSTATPELPAGSRVELKAQAVKIDAEIAALRKSSTLSTPVAQREAVSKQIEALQAQRSATLKAWAKTPGATPGTSASFQYSRP